MRLEIQYAIQCRVDANRTRTTPRSIKPLLDHLAVNGAVSLLDHSVQDWLARLPAAASTTPPRAFLGFAIDCLLDVRDGTGWDSEYPRDVWLLRRLGVAAATAPAWISHRCSHAGCGSLPNAGADGVSPAASGLANCAGSHRDRATVAAHARPGSSSGPTALDRAALETYLARLAVAVPHAKTRSSEIGCVAGFLRAVRQHRWASLPAEAELYPGDYPRRDECQRPRAIPEFVMNQLESADNLDRLTDPRIRLLVEILIRTGLRIGDATRLPLDCLIRDHQGAVYLRYRNHKMRRDAVVPIDDELTTMIEAQQIRASDNGSPAPASCCHVGSANPDGRFPIHTGTFDMRLKRWMADIAVIDEFSCRVKVTAHQFRHTYATRLINNDVPQEVVRRLLDHTSHTMTARYARLADTTIREQWERAQKINIHGEPVDTSADGPLADAAWMKQNLSRAKMALPNGYCGLPMQKSCPHANACLTCPLFVTTAEFLPQHHQQLDATRALITRAETDGHIRVVEMNRSVETNLLTIISTLEHDASLPVRRPSSGETCCGEGTSDAF